MPWLGALSLQIFAALLAATSSRAALADSLESVTTFGTTEISESVTVSRHFMKPDEKENHAFLKKRRETDQRRREELLDQGIEPPPEKELPPEPSPLFWKLGYGFVRTANLVEDYHHLLLAGLGYEFSPTLSVFGTINGISSPDEDYGTSGFDAHVVYTLPFWPPETFPAVQFWWNTSYHRHSMDGRATTRTARRPESIGAQELGQTSHTIAASIELSEKIELGVDVNETAYGVGSVQAFAPALEDNPTISARTGLLGMIGNLRSFPDWRIGAFAEYRPSKELELGLGGRFNRYELPAVSDDFAFHGRFSYFFAPNWKGALGGDFLTGGTNGFVFSASLGVGYVF